MPRVARLGRAPHKTLELPPAPVHAAESLSKGRIPDRKGRLRRRTRVSWPKRQFRRSPAACELVASNPVASETSCLPKFASRFAPPVVILPRTAPGGLLLRYRPTMLSVRLLILLSLLA